MREEYCKVIKDRVLCPAVREDGTCSHNLEFMTDKDKQQFEIPNYIRNLKRLFEDHKNMMDFYDWVLEQGKSFCGLNRDIKKERDLIREGAPHTRKECYYNSQMVILGDRGLKYFEGWYKTNSLPIPIEHGFCVFNGKVIDITVSMVGSKCVKEYFGVHIPFEFISNNIFETGMAESLLHKFFRKRSQEKNQFFKSF